MTSELDDDSAVQAGSAWTTSDPALPKTGHLLAGKYRIDGILGRGGMGVVAAGHQLNLDRPVAIKFSRHALGESARQRFTREAMAIAKLENEHVVRVFDAGEEQGAPFIVMERLFGNDLADELRLRPLDPETTVRYLIEACEALADAHACGIVHRDLKPSNLFITTGANGRRSVKVLDFGVSKWLDDAPDGETPHSTGTHGFVGTPAYMSPEQLTTPNAVDQRADVWALGVVLYQCLSGRRPFDGRSGPQLCAAILSVDPPPFDPKLAVPESLAAIARRCLRKKPAERYASVRDLARELAAFRVPRARLARAQPALITLVVLGTLAVAFLLARGPTRAEATAELATALEPASERPARSVPPAASPASLTPPAASAPSSSLAPPSVATSTGLLSAHAKARSRATAPRLDARPTHVAPVAEPAPSTAPSAAHPEPPPRIDAKPLYRR